MALLALSACKSITASIDPELSTITRPPGQLKSTLTVAYYIPDAARLQMVTPPGAADSINYYPYRDLEPAFVKMLGNVYGRVVHLTAPLSKEELAQKSISFVIMPTIDIKPVKDPKTFIHTKFDIELSCAVTNQNGAPVANLKVVGTGAIDHNHWTGDWGGAGRLAATDALGKMQTVLRDAPELK